MDSLHNNIVAMVAYIVKLVGIRVGLDSGLVSRINSSSAFSYKEPMRSSVELSNFSGNDPIVSCDSCEN
jgi:hypothetical protein